MSDTIFFRFPDQATADTFIPPGASVQGETVTQMPEGAAAISVIGWHDATPGNPASVAGYLVNALPSAFNEDGTPVIPAAVASYQVFPATPIRVFG